MIGDKIIVQPEHTRAAEGVYLKIKEKKGQATFGVTVAGESGSGKSEVASEIARLFKERDGIKSIILHQDDYFIYPPKTNDEVRRKDIKNVGMHEVKLDLMDEDLKSIKDSDCVTLKKPLIDYDNNVVLEETIDVRNIMMIIAEGTYTTFLKNADFRVFIDRTYIDTLEHRKERARDKIDDYTNRILKIEHSIISGHKKDADIIINKDYSV